MKIINNYSFLIFILIVAAVLRFWQLGSVPLSPDWDEVALGYNAYSIMHTGRDEYGVTLPIVLQSYDDFKPALYAYLTMPFIAVFDLSVFAVRLPSAIFGLLTILAFYFFIRELFKHQKINILGKEFSSEQLALLSSFLLAVSPWHIQFSRIAFESNIGLSFNVFGALFFLKGLKKSWYLVFSAICFSLSLYAYQSEKVFVPLLILTLVVIYFKQLKLVGKKFLILAAVIGMIVALPIGIYTVTNKDALSRAQTVSFTSQKTPLLQDSIAKLEHDTATHDYVGVVLDNRRITYVKKVLAGYLTHFDINWLFLKGDAINRHHAPGVALLYLVTLPFFLIGIFILFFAKKQSGVELSTKLLIFLWILITPIPASITIDVPHAVRTLNEVPMLQILIAFGVLATYAFIKRIIINAFLSYAIIGSLVILSFGNFVYYLDQYFVQQNYFYALDWQYGYKELVDYLKPIHQNYRKVIVANDTTMTESYMFFLFYLKYDPATYLREGGTPKEKAFFKGEHFSNFEFRSFNYYGEPGNTLFAGSKDSFPEEFKVIKPIYYPNGTVAMKVVEKD